MEKTDNYGLGKNEMKTFWLKEHLETFVKPVLDFIPEHNGTNIFSVNEMSVIKNIWRSVKRSCGKKVLILPGRDVFIFEILARRENFNTIFLPGCSRQSVEYFKGRIPHESYIFDTGFVGSIPRCLGLGETDYKMISAANRSNNTQVFKNLSGSRSLALKIEKTPKYWQSGRIIEGKLVLDLNNLEEFKQAALLTIQIYKDSSPAFVEGKHPIPRFI